MKQYGYYVNSKGISIFVIPTKAVYLVAFLNIMLKPKKIVGQLNVIFL